MTSKRGYITLYLSTVAVGILCVEGFNALVDPSALWSPVKGGIERTRVLDAGEKVDDHALVQTWHALASTTATAPTARDVELINVATNNLSRIEVLNAPTPESPANSLGGSVNMVQIGRAHV